MQVLFTEQAWDEYQLWLKEDPGVLKKINILIKAIQQDPFKGIGKPEPLRFGLSGYWSRRINLEHRLVYFIAEHQKAKTCVVLQCWFHY